MKYSNGVTVHSVVRNEPFIYYSIKSVYDYVDKILLYDTGSYDKHTLSDIQKLLEEDKYKKITFKQIEIDIDETKWSTNNIHRMIQDGKGKRTVGWVRKKQIEDTETEFFLILDGDEVHYKKGIYEITKNIIPSWNNKYICGYIPIRWYSNLNQTHNEYPLTGRIFKTDQLWLNDDSPNEIHIDKYSKQLLHINHDKCVKFNYLPAYAHFEVLLKPWRRTPSNISSCNQPLPEVMVDNKYYIERFLGINTPSEVTSNTNKEKDEDMIEVKKDFRIPDLIQIASNCHSVLEIGCGEGSFIKNVKSPIKIGIDAFRKILDNNNNDKNVTFLNYDLSKGLSGLFLNKSIDCIVGIDIIEHFEKEKAFELLRECENVSRNFILLFVPVGNHPQTKDDRGLGNDYFQTHRSVWYPEDLEKLGYIVNYIPNYHNQPGKDPGAMFCIKEIK